MFPHMRLLFQPTPTPMLRMLPARPMDTALPPPMRYSTSSPMTLPVLLKLGDAAKVIRHEQLQCQRPEHEERGHEMSVDATDQFRHFSHGGHVGGNVQGIGDEQ